MNKNVKKAIVLVIIAVLILAIVWIVYEAVKPDSAEIKPTSDLLNENMGIDNIINDFTESNVINEIEQNTVANEVDEEKEEDKEDLVVEGNSNNDDESSTAAQSNSEVVSGTSQTREERAVELAEEFYKEKYGEPKDIYFEYDSVYKDGRYIVTAGNAGGSNNKFFFVDLNTGLEKKK